MSRNALIGGIAVIIVLSLARVATTHRVFSQVVDEPAHVAAGFDWLLTGDYKLDIEHPPLARAILAIPLRAIRDTAPQTTDWVGYGNELLLTNNRYVANLARVRIPNLLFFAIAIGATAAWALHIGGPAVSLIAAGIVASVQPMLAHAGVATTDMAGVATTITALYLFLRWLELPTRPRALVLGVAIGIGLLCKFSFLIFFPAGAAVLVLSRRRLPLKTLWPAIVIVPLIIWAGYRFQFSTLADASPHAVGLVRSATKSERMGVAAQTIPLPAPLFIAGILNVKVHDQGGHLAFLFGKLSSRGFWYYFPVTLFFKTPLPLLILALLSLFVKNRNAIELMLVAAAMLAVTMTASINIGVRHVLVAIPPIAIAAALAVMWLWKQRAGRVLAVALLGWLLIGSLAAHPDYLSWFNEAAGKSPEEIAVDSNLDWGQDLLRLKRVCRELDIRELHVALLTSAPLESLGLPQLHGIGDVPVTGWVAASETMLKLRDPALRWLDQQPYRRVGTSIRLYDMR